MSNLGGERPCRVQVVDDPDTTSNRSTVVDLSQVTGSGGAVWSLPHGGDLDANLVRLRGDDAIGRHVNSEVDVLITVWEGTGEVTIDDQQVELRPGITLLIPRGSARAIRAGSSGIGYLSVHRRRDPLAIARR